MPLIPCPECKEQVADDAFKCPKCGKQLRKPQRSVFGKICKWSFIVFNVLMLIWIVTGVGGNAAKMQGMSEAEQAGAAVGTGIGVMMLVVLWVFGDIILGLFTLFTRPKGG